MGAKLGYILYKNYPHIFSIDKFYKNNPPTNNYHIYKPHLDFLWFPPSLANIIIDSNQYNKLDKLKWNIVLTHLYSVPELETLKEMFPHDKLKIIKITYELTEIEDIVKRFMEVTNRNEDITYPCSMMRKNLDNGIGDAFRIPFISLKDTQNLDLSNLVKYIIEK